jgi:hypothetical protein
MPAYGVDRAERRRWLLKNHRDLCSAHPLHFLFGEPDQIAPPKEYVAAHDACGGGEQPDDRQGAQALA